MKSLFFLSALCVGISLVAAETCTYYRTSSTRYYTSCGSFGWSRCARYRLAYSSASCYWSTTATGWTNTGSCSRSCGGGTLPQRGTRRCTNLSYIPSSCTSKKYTTRTVACNTHKCPINGGWTGWSSWTNTGGCSKSCGYGVQNQISSRTCTNPAPLYNGANCVGSTTQTRTVSCKVKECPINGGWSGYSSWRNSGSCSKSCGDGVQNQVASRTCTNPAPAHNGANCVGSSTKTRTLACKVKECPINGGWSGWSSWTNTGSCSESCGDGVQNQVASRTCTNPAPAHNGANCVGSPTNTRTVTCKVKECPIHGGWSTWSSWGNVTTCESCGGGTFEQARTHTCTNPAPQHGGRTCSGSTSERRIQNCNTDPCPVNGGWSDWGEWERQENSQCSASCGDGTFTEEKRRTCSDPEPAYGGEECVGDDVETRPAPCNLRECPVDGGWSEYTAWTYEGECPVECGGSPVTELRSRTCDSPSPAHGGRDCEGDAAETREGECNTDPCPVNGGWSDWGEWERQKDSQCSASCGDGAFTEEKRRTCSNPKPAYGGEECVGDDVETMPTPCNLRECPVDGGWSEWSGWEAGDYTIVGTSASRTLVRSRTCSNPAPQFGGGVCEGSAKETQNHECHITECEDICSKSQSNFPYPHRIDAYYTCNDNKDGMVQAVCSKDYYFDEDRCAPICLKSDFGEMSGRTRCGNDVFCVFGRTFSLSCYPQDNKCRACISSL